MYQGFFRAAAAVPAVTVADPKANTEAIIALLERMQTEVGDIDLIVLPELCITGYTCSDLFHNQSLLDAARKQLFNLTTWSASYPSTLVVGVPLVVDGVLYNCAAVINRGYISAVIPKTYLPNYNEFYEKRWWQPAPQLPVRDAQLDTLFGKVPFGTQQLIEVNGVKVGVEICEDLWAPITPGTRAALGGAEVIVNLSASNDLIGKYGYLTSLIKGQSARSLCGYVYASAGFGESTTDLVFDGKAIVAENGSLLSCNRRWATNPQYSVADIDILALRRDRLHLGTWTDCVRREDIAPYPCVGVSNHAVNAEPRTILRSINPTPFVPADNEHLSERCEEIINIQVSGLMKRLQHTHCRSLVVGISGGLDSTLALLVAVRAFDRLQLPPTGITGVTMPGFGTTTRTKGNADRLMESLGITIREISIVPAVEQHFRDINHDPAEHDVTYENSQARMRTMLLMDIANQTGGMVLGTGDLSELALGWATYNGDHMSMYGVNASVPKTLVRHLTRYFADHGDPACRETLLDIIDTPVSPELLPADADGNIAQKTEDLVGPYELHDFFLYYMLRYGFTAERIYLMACQAFEGRYDAATIRHWQQVMIRRFFAQQFKRSCLPDGPKVGSVCLSPRGDWRMPSDASAAAFR